MKKVWKGLRTIMIVLSMLLWFYIGILLLKIYLNFTPDSSLEIALLKTFGFDTPFSFLSTATILFTSVPPTILLFHINSKSSTIKIPVGEENSFITDTALANLVKTIAVSSGSVESVNNVNLQWSKKKGLSIEINVSVSSKVDISRVSNRLRERIKQELEFSLGITHFKNIDVVVEQTEDTSEGRKIIYG